MRLKHNKTMKLWHASRTEGVIEQFHPFSHFATLAVAMNRSHSMVFENTPLSFYLVELRASNPLKMNDLNDSNRSNNHSLINFADTLYYETKVIKSHERDNLFQYINSPENQSQGFLVLGKMLREKGYDAIVYQNEWESSSKELSWINLDSQSVNIVQKMNKDAVASYLA